MFTPVLSIIQLNNSVGLTWWYYGHMFYGTVKVIFMASARFCFSCSLRVEQADLPALLLAHLPAGHPELFSDDVRHQPCVLLRQHRAPVAAAAFPPLQIAHQQLGLHQPGSHFSSGTWTRAHTRTQSDIYRIVFKHCFLPFGLGAQVSVNAGYEERPCEVLEAAGVVNGGQPSLLLPAHPVRQPAEEGRAVCVGPRAAGRSG